MSMVLRDLLYDAAEHLTNSLDARARQNNATATALYRSRAIAALNCAQLELDDLLVIAKNDLFVSNIRWAVSSFDRGEDALALQHLQDALRQINKGKVEFHFMPGAALV